MAVGAKKSTFFGFCQSCFPRPRGRTGEKMTDCARFFRSVQVIKIEGCGAFSVTAHDATASHKKDQAPFTFYARRFENSVVAIFGALKFNLTCFWARIPFCVVFTIITNFARVTISDRSTGAGFELIARLFHKAFWTNFCMRKCWLHCWVLS